MAKRILILSSSPRKGGNSDSLCDDFLFCGELKKREMTLKRFSYEIKRLITARDAARVACIINLARKRMMPRRSLTRWWLQMLLSWRHPSISTR